MFMKIGPECHCLKGQGWNSNVYKEDGARIIMFEKIGLEFQCFKDRAEIPMFIKTAQEF